MAEFKRGDKVLIFRGYGEHERVGEYVAPNRSEGWHCIFVDGFAETFHISALRRAPRVVKQMCQWYRHRYGGEIIAHSTSGLWIGAVNDPGENWIKVGKPFEQTLEVPE